MNRVMLVGRILQIRINEENIVIFLKVSNFNDKNNIVINVIFKTGECNEEIKTKLKEQSLIEVQGYIDYFKDMLVVVANKISILDSTNGDSDE